MILESVAGGLLGVFTKLAPSVLDFFDRKSLRKFELEKLDRQLQMEKLYNEHRNAEMAHIENALSLAGATTVQAAEAGTFAGILNSIVKTTIALSIVGLYIGIKVFVAKNFIASGVPLSAALEKIWADSDQVTLCAIVSYYFLAAGSALFGKK